MKKVLVTGGTGFIGRRVVALLKNKGHRVTLLRARLENSKKVRAELIRAKPDTVIHLAWEGLPDYGARMSAKNLAQSLQFFLLLAELRVPKVVGVGTCWEYERINTGPRAYMLAKQTLRKFGEDLFAGQGTFIWVRPFFVFGAGKPKKSLFPSLIAQARERNISGVKYDGWSDFIYVDDVAEALVLLATRRALSGTYDIGSGKLTRVGRVAQLVAQAFRLKPISLHRQKSKGIHANIRVLRALGWRPHITIEQGIRKMIQHP